MPPPSTTPRAPSSRGAGGGGRAMGGVAKWWSRQRKDWRPRSDKRNTPDRMPMLLNACPRGIIDPPPRVARIWLSSTKVRRSSDRARCRHRPKLEDAATKIARTWPRRGRKLADAGPMLVEVAEQSRQVGEIRTDVWGGMFIVDPRPRVEKWARCPGERGWGAPKVARVGPLELGVGRRSV